MKKLLSLVLILVSLSGSVFANTCNEKMLWGGWEGKENNIFESIAFEDQEQSKTFNYWFKGGKENNQAKWSLDNCNLKITGINNKPLYLFEIKVENDKLIKLVNEKNNKVFIYEKMRD